MPSIQVIKENSLGINRGLYGSSFGNTLSDGNISTLLAEGAAVEVGTEAGGTEASVGGGGIVSGPAPYGRWMVTGNNTLGQSTSGNSLSHAFRTIYRHSSDPKKVKLGFYNWAISNDVTPEDLLTTQQITIGNCYAEANGVRVAVNFSSASSRLMTPGEDEVFSDELAPAQFGLTSFANRNVLVRGELTRDTAGAFPATLSFGREQDTTNNQYVFYNQASTTITNLNGSGAFTSTGTAPTSSSYGYRPVLLGFYDGDLPASWAVFGDSIQGRNPNTQNIAADYGLTYVGKMLQNVTLDGGYISYLNVAKWGLRYGEYSYAASRVRNWYKYTRFGFDGMGTNNFNTSGTGATPAQMMSYARDEWQRMRAYGIEKILRVSLLPRTNTGTPSSPTGSDQTYRGPGWAPGGFVDQWHRMLEAAAKNGEIYQFYRIGSVRNSIIKSELSVDDSRYYKWTLPANEGTHPTDLQERAIADELRPIINSYK